MSLLRKTVGSVVWLSLIGALSFMISFAFAQDIDGPGDGIGDIPEPFFCGNGTVDPGEECDDGNENNNDYCTNECQEQTEGPVKPILECVYPENDETFTAYFGYENFNSGTGTITIPFGPENKLTPSSYQGAQPTEFGQPMEVSGRPGRTPFYPGHAFTVNFDPSETVVWTLEGPDNSTRTATASDNEAQYCDIFCGDNRVNQESEQCDDGNTENGDGCNETCQVEISPVLECVQHDNGSTGTLTAHFGYSNDYDQQVTIPHGSDNKMTPSSYDGTQPENFDPGRTPFYPNAAFTVEFDSNDTLVWNLNGSTSTASDNPAQECEAVCGDGIVNQESEECDDGNTQSNDGCSATCTVESSSQGGGSVGGGGGGGVLLDTGGDDETDDPQDDPQDEPEDEPEDDPQDDPQDEPEEEDEFEFSLDAGGDILPPSEDISERTLLAEGEGDVILPNQLFETGAAGQTGVSDRELTILYVLFVLALLSIGAFYVKYRLRE